MKIDFDRAKSATNARDRGLPFERPADFEWEQQVTLRLDPEGLDFFKATGTAGRRDAPARHAAQRSPSPIVNVLGATSL